MVISKGKNLLFILFYIFPDIGVIILILLFIFLRKDLLHWVRELGIDHLI
jgi:hypothetical protein